MTKTFNVLFHLKKPKNYTNGPMPIYMRLTVDGQRFEMNTSRDCNPENWNSASGRMNGNREEAKALNNFLDLMKSKVFEAQRELMSAGYEVTASTLKDKLTGKEERQKTLLEVYRYHNQQFEELVGKEFSEGTLKKFKTCLTSLEAFIKWKTGQCDLPLKNLSYQFIVDYEFYLKTEQSIQHNTAMGYIKKLKKIVRQCIANDWLSKDPFMSYKIKIRDTHRNFLLVGELKRVEEKKIFIERLSVVRDIFLFSCYTGLAYSDVEKLTANDISIGIDGEKWIFTNRTKTETPTRVPLLPPAISILEKYANSPATLNSGKLLPVLSNQRMNSYLKELADICDIKKELTFHCARHTFATTVTLTNGVPIETVSKMLGHRSLRTTQQYAKIIDLKVSHDMSSLKEILKVKASEVKPDKPRVANGQKR